LKISQIGKAAQRGQFSEIDYRVSLGTLLYLNILVDGLPHTCANHVHVNVYETAMQILVGFNGGGVITIFPKRPCRFLRWLYSCAVRTAMSCILSAITFEPVSFTKR